MDETAADVLAALRGSLPARLVASADFGRVVDYLGTLDADVARYPHYLEWTLGDDELDLDFAFPTTIDGFLRLAIEDLCAEVTRGLARRELLTATLARVRAMALDDPLFPIGVTLAVDRLTAAPAVGFTFLDYRPEVGPLSAAELARVFELVGGTAGRDVDAIFRHVQPFRLGHVGLGWRAGRLRHKAYVLGTLGELVAHAREGDGGPLLAPHRAALDQLIAHVGARRAHMVVDVEDGRALRFGFELNFGSSGDPEYAALVAGTLLWTEHVSPDARAGVASLAAPLTGRLRDGGAAEGALCHVKVSFDGGAPAWKAYLVLVNG